MDREGFQQAVRKVSQGFLSDVLNTLFMQQPAVDVDEEKQVEIPELDGSDEKKMEEAMQERLRLKQAKALVRKLQREKQQREERLLSQENQREREEAEKKAMEEERKQKEEQESQQRREKERKTRKDRFLAEREKRKAGLNAHTKPLKRKSALLHERMFHDFYNRICIPEEQERQKKLDEIRASKVCPTLQELKAHMREYSNGVRPLPPKTDHNLPPREPACSSRRGLMRRKEYGVRVLKQFRPKVVIKPSPVVSLMDPRPAKFTPRRPRVKRSRFHVSHRRRQEREEKLSVPELKRIAQEATEKFAKIGKQVRKGNEIELSIGLAEMLRAKIDLMKSVSQR